MRKKRDETRRDEGFAKTWDFTTYLNVALSRRHSGMQIPKLNPKFQKPPKHPATLLSEEPDDAVLKDDCLRKRRWFVTDRPSGSPCISFTTSCMMVGSWVMHVSAYSGGVEQKLSDSDSEVLSRMRSGNMRLGYGDDCFVSDGARG